MSAPPAPGSPHRRARPWVGRSAATLIAVSVVAALGLGVAPSLVSNEKAAAQNPSLNPMEKVVAGGFYKARLTYERTTPVYRPGYSSSNLDDVLVSCLTMSPRRWDGRSYKARCSVSWLAREYRRLTPTTYGYMLLRRCKLVPTRSWARRWGSTRAIIVPTVGRFSVLNGTATTKCRVVQRLGRVDRFGRYTPTIASQAPIPPRVPPVRATPAPPPAAPVPGYAGPPPFPPPPPPSATPLS